MNTVKTPSTYGAPKMGCYLDQSYRNSDSHNAAVVRLAMEFGFVPDAETTKLLAREDYDVLSENGRSDSELLNWCADEAESWLNEQETRSFMFWGNDGDAGAFGLWCNVDGAREDCGFVNVSDRASARFKAEADCNPGDSSYPADDYRGEWLHVSDHGNATLYVREDSPSGFCDREIWSVV